MLLWLRNTENVHLKAKQSFLTMQYSAITTFPLYLYKAGHGPKDFLNCVNTCMTIFTHGVKKLLYELNFSNKNKF